MKSLKIYKLAKKYSIKKEIIVMDKTDLHSSLLFLMIKLEEARATQCKTRTLLLQ